MHRNSQKRYYEKDYVYFVTAKTYQNYPYFEEEILCELFLEELLLCKRLKQCKFYAFALNYDHFHLMVKPHTSADISKVVQFLKRHVSRNANMIMSPCERDTFCDDVIFEGDIGQCRLRKDFNEINRKVNILQNQFISKHGTDKPHPPFKWHKSFHDHIIRDETDFERHYHYTVYNYLKHGLPANWKYTSLRYQELVEAYSNY